MRKSRLLAASILATGLTAAPVFALYTGLTVTGGGEEISTITLKLPGNDPVTAERGTTGTFGVNTTGTVTPGFGTATITTKDGKTRTVTAFIDEGSNIRTYMPTGDCIIPGFCGWGGFDYSHFSPSSGDDGDQWGFSLQGLVPLGGMMNLQLGGGYHNVTGSYGLDVDSWGGSGALIFNMGNWRAGPVVGIQSNGNDYNSVNTFNYGAFAEVFFPGYSLAAKIGGFDSDIDYGDYWDGFYVGGSASAYPLPDLAVSVSYDHIGFNGPYSSDESDWTGSVEYLVSHETPISVIAGYTRTGFSNSSFNVDTFFIGLRFYCDDNGATTLEERHDTGTVDWGTTFSPLQFRF